jgi:hypothetical membrane protein
MKFNLNRFLIFCGLIGPAIFFLSVYILFPLFYPGYDMRNQGISDLGAYPSPVKILTNVFGFSLFGIFIMLFALGLFRSKETNIIGKIASLLIFVTGILMYLVGIFYGGYGGEHTMLGSFHNMVSNYQFPVLAAGYTILAISVLFNKKMRWLAAPIIMLGLLSLYFASIFFTPGFIPERGIIQRIAIGLPYLLMMIIAAAFYRVQIVSRGKR